MLVFRQYVIVISIWLLFECLKKLIVGHLPVAIEWLIRYGGVGSSRREELTRIAVGRVIMKIMNRCVSTVLVTTELGEKCSL